MDKSPAKWTLADVMADVKAMATFKEYLREHQSAEYLTAWLLIKRLAQKPRADRAPEFGEFKRTYIIVDAPAQLFFDFDVREVLEKTKFPEDIQLNELSATLLSGLEDGFINMMSDDVWKDHIIKRTSPKWARRKLVSFKKAPLRQSDELLLTHFQHE